MAETPLNSGHSVVEIATDNAGARPARWKSAILAGLLSLLFPGMGQLYNRQQRKALAFAVISEIPGLLLLLTRVMFSFWTMLATFLIGLMWRIFIAAEAASGSGTLKKTERLPPAPKLTYSLLTCAFLVASFFPTSRQIINRSGFGAFKVPSDSMCPTICTGDRLMADMHAYRDEPPKRGDLVIVKNPTSNAILIKRVVGVSGDLIAPGPGGSISVNGQSFSYPAHCSAPARLNEQPGYATRFQPATVPQGSYFLVGDNLTNSFDSRYREFGNVTSAMIRGKPLYLYWSPSASRIGCSLH